MSTKRVLITGANGYLGQNLLNSFLEAGHSVRAVVRSQAKADQLASIFDKYKPTGKLDFGVVPDITTPGAFDKVLQSATAPFDTVVHSASPYDFRTGLGSTDFLAPAVQGTTGILASIVAHAPGVRRVVMTSSIAAIADFANPITQPAKVYTESDWTPMTAEIAVAIENPGAVYQASKKHAELAAWDFVRDHQPNFDLAVINPTMIYGPVHDPDSYSDPKQLPQSLYFIYEPLMAPGVTPEDAIPPSHLPLYVDVRDVAEAHLRAATVPAAGGKRFIACAEQGEMTSQRIANILRDAFPELRARVPRGDPAAWRLPEGHYDASGARAREVLGLTFRTPEETITDAGRQLIAIAKRAEQLK